MTTLEKEQELSNYIKGWTYSRLPDWQFFHKSTSEHRRSEIYHLKDGHLLMDLLNSIMGYIEERLLFDDNENLIPHKFSSIDQFLQSNDSAYNYYKSQYHLLEENIEGENTSYIIIEMTRIIQSFKAMRDRCWKLYQDGLYLPTPYQQAILYLHNCDIDKFVDIIDSLMNDVPYSICKIERNEGYYHTLFHVITSLLGFRPISEKATAIGRMDTRIETPNAIYILEFKYSESFKDLSDAAFQQIVDKDYGLQDHISFKKVFGIGISFSGKTNRINGKKHGVIYTPPMQ